MSEFDYNAELLERLRQLDLVTYLENIGHEPLHVKKNGTEYWYLSPLRNESTASFKVNRPKK